MELREIQTFLQVAQRNSFSKAADALGYSQAAVTIQIKNLEQELGIHLFDRLGKQTVLTHHGEIFYGHAVSILRELSRARAAVTEADELTGVLSIGTIESICASILPGLLQEFHARWPKVKIRIELDSPEVLLDHMNKNSIDLVYLMDQRIYDARWEKVLEEAEDIVFVSAPSHPFAGRAGLTLDQVITQPFLLTEKNASYRYVLDRYLAAYGKKIEPFLEIGNTEFIISLLKQNTGLSFLPEFSIREEAAAGALKILPVEDFHLRVWRQIFYHKDKWVTREMNAFIQLAGGRPESSPAVPEALQGRKS